jgi:hypothetical protein
VSEAFHDPYETEDEYLGPELTPEEEAFWAEEQRLDQLREARDELDEIDRLEWELGRRSYETQLMEQAAEARARNEARLQAYREQAIADLEAEREERQYELGSEVEDWERARARRLDPDTIDHVIEMKASDESFGEAADRLLPRLDWGDPEVRRAQLAHEIEIAAGEGEVDRAEEDAELPAEILRDPEVSDEELEDLGDFKAAFAADRRGFERERYPLTDEEAAHAAERIMDAHAQGDTSFTLEDAEDDAWSGRLPDMRNPGDRRRNMAAGIREDMIKAGEWTPAQEADYRHELEGHGGEYE